MKLAPVLLCALPAAGQEPSVPRPFTAPPDRRVELDFQHYYTAEQLDDRLRQLAEAYPEFLTLESIGKSRAGKDLWVVSASAGGGADASDRPGVFIAGSLGRDDLQGAEMALYTLVELVQNHARDASIGRLLGQCVFYVAPCLNPDLRGEAFAALEGGGEIGGPSPRVDLQRNFPIGWSPATRARNGGPYPLSEPETRAVTDFLLAHPNICVVQTYGPAPPATAVAPTGAAWDDGDAVLYAALCSQASGVDSQAPYPVSACVDRGGSLLEFASRQLGAYAFRVGADGFDRSDAARMPRVSELALLGQRAARTTLHLSQALPRLSIGRPGTQRLRDNQWQVDFPVANRGRMPTLSAIGIEHHAAPPPELNIQGAAVVAAMTRAPADEVFRAVAHTENGIELMHLAGSAELQVRLVVEADPASTLAVDLRSLRAGHDWLQVTLE